MTVGGGKGGGGRGRGERVGGGEIEMRGETITPSLVIGAEMVISPPPSSIP